MITIQRTEAVAALRRIFFHLVDVTDGMTPETGEAGGQPQISISGGAWTNTTNTLVAIGNGRYYVELTAAEVLQNDGAVIESRYKSANTAEGVGTTAQIVTYHNSGLSTLTAALVTSSCTSALGTYDPPTKAELDIAQAAIIADIGASEVAVLAAIALAQSDITDLKDEALGSWVVDPDANTLTLYRENGVTVLKVFDLISTTESVPAYIQKVPQ